MVAAHREVEALSERVRAAFDLADPAPVQMRWSVVLFVAGDLAAVAADALRHVEVEAVLLARRRRSRRHAPAVGGRLAVAATQRRRTADIGAIQIGACTRTAFR